MWIPQTPPSALEYFSSLVASDEHFPLLEAAACIAQDEYPELDVAQTLGDVDQLLARLKRRIAADATALVRLKHLHQFFFRDLGFGAAVNNYYDSDNSYVHAVLKTRRGIPITLAVVWLELAQGIGLAARGVSFPGHFLVRVALPKGQVVIDPLNGESLSREDLNERLEPFRRRSGLVDDYELPLSIYLQAASPREILARMLRNLKDIHRASFDNERLAAVLDRSVILQPEIWPERRDRGLAFAEIGQRERAIEDLQKYLDHTPEAMDRSLIAQKIDDLRKANA